MVNALLVAAGVLLRALPAIAATVTTGDGSANVPSGAADIGTTIDEAIFNYGIPLIGVGMFIVGGTQMANNVRPGSSGGGVGFGPLGTMLGGLVVAGAPTLIKSSMESTSAATFGPLPPAVGGLFSIYDPILLAALMGAYVCRVLCRRRV
jgi:hypothetical protein